MTQSQLQVLVDRVRKGELTEEDAGTVILRKHHCRPDGRPFCHVPRSQREANSFSCRRLIADHGVTLVLWE